MYMEGWMVGFREWREGVRERNNSDTNFIQAFTYQPSITLSVTITRTICLIT